MEDAAMLPKEFEWRRNESSWGWESWLIAHGHPVAIVNVLSDVCYWSHRSENGAAGGSTQRSPTPELGVAAAERWALAHARRPMSAAVMRAPQARRSERLAAG